jgi:hypothetical protein
MTLNVERREAVSLSNMGDPELQFQAPVIMRACDAFFCSLGRFAPIIDLLCGPRHRQESGPRAIRSILVSRICSVSDRFQQHVLECHRLAADCMQLAGDAPSQAQRSHFLRMARTWTVLAERGPHLDGRSVN